MSKKQVKKLREVGPQVNPDAVRALKAMLAKAESGELQGFVMGTVLVGEEYGSILCFEPSEINVFGVVGLIEYLKRRVVFEIVE